jgi:hypothetical protein
LQLALVRGDSFGEGVEVAWQLFLGAFALSLWLAFVRGWQSPGAEQIQKFQVALQVRASR